MINGESRITLHLWLAFYLIYSKQLRQYKVKLQNHLQSHQTKFQDSVPYDIFFSSTYTVYKKMEMEATAKTLSIISEKRGVLKLSCFENRCNK